MLFFSTQVGAVCLGSFGDTGLELWDRVNKCISTYRLKWFRSTHSRQLHMKHTHTQGPGTRNKTAHSIQFAYVRRQDSQHDKWFKYYMFLSDSKFYAKTVLNNSHTQIYQLWATNNWFGWYWFSMTDIITFFSLTNTIISRPSFLLFYKY